MSLISRLESKFGRFAVPNLTVILIIGQVFLYLAQYVSLDQAGGNVLERVALFPAAVLSGEVWRIVTFLFTPPTMNLIFAFFFWYLFYLMGTTLEANWGAFRYNLFLLIGYVSCIAMAFVTYYATGLNMPANSGFLYGTVFLAFARLYPDFVMYIMFILPVKIKWLALLQWIGYALAFIFGTWMDKGMIFASVTNYLVFFGRDIWRDLKQGRRRMQYHARANKISTRLVHKCAICGLTSDSAPQMQFRYCSKCDGELCYCSEHLQNHEHVTRGATAAPVEKV
jgi:hypothetical protein